MTDHFAASVAHQGMIYLAETGSTALGTNIHTSDYDLKGICIETPSIIFGPKPFHTWRFRYDPSGEVIPEGSKTPPGSTEGVVYSLRHWTMLASKGDFGAITMLWTPWDHVHLINPDAGNRLRGFRKTFITRDFYQSAHGYLFSQKRILEKEYKPKAAYHAVRIGWQAAELLTTRDLQLPIQGEQRRILMEIRSGATTPGYAMELVDESLDILREAVLTTSVPDNVDALTVTTWVTDIYLDFWKAKKWLP